MALYIVIVLLALLVGSASIKLKPVDSFKKMSQKDMSEKPKKPEKIKIKVDMDFLMNVLKTVEGLKKEINLIRQSGFKPEAPEVEVKDIPPQRDYIFQCVEIFSIDKIPSSPQELIDYGKRSVEFKEKVETLMKEYKVIQLSGQFLHKFNGNKKQ